MTSFESLQIISYKILNELFSENLIIDIIISQSLIYIALTESGRECPKPEEKLDMNQKIIIYCKKNNIELYANDI